MAATLFRPRGPNHAGTEIALNIQRHFQFPDEEEPRVILTDETKPRIVLDDATKPRVSLSVDEIGSALGAVREDI